MNRIDDEIEYHDYAINMAETMVFYYPANVDSPSCSYWMIPGTFFDDWDNQ